MSKEELLSKMGNKRAILLILLEFIGGITKKISPRKFHSWDMLNAKAELFNLLNDNCRTNTGRDSKKRNMPYG